MKNLIAAMIAVSILLPSALLGADDNLVAKVNGVGITRAEFDRNWPTFIRKLGIAPDHGGDPSRFEEFRIQLLDLLIDRELFYQEARKKGFKADEAKLKEQLDRSATGFSNMEEFEKALVKNGLSLDEYNDMLRRGLIIQALIEEKVIKKITVTDEEIEEFYNKNINRFQVPAQVRARHVLIKVAKDADDAAKKEANDRAAEVYKKARGGADFAELAKEYSEATSAPNGGDLGFFTRGQMPAFEEAAFALKPGEVSEPVETQYGYHVIKVEEKRESSTLSLSDASQGIRELIARPKVNEAMNAEIEALRSEAKIEKML